MGLEQIGLEAIFKNVDFLGGMSEYLKAVDTGSDRTRTAGQQMTANLALIGGTVVTGALALAAAGISAITAAALASIPIVLGWAETLDGIGDVLGTDAGESAALAVAIEGVGGNVEGITGQMAFLTRGLVDAKGELGPTGEVMKELGISFRDANGQILPATDILSSVADVIGNMPDGLEKTRLMTQLFGKSGKDLSDVMSALANGGLEAADQKARALGLTLSENTSQSAIELGREFKTIGMMGRGLMISLGSDLLPVLKPLIERFIELGTQALPEIRKAIKSVMPAVRRFVDGVVQAIPKVIEWFGKVADFLKNNQPLIIGVLGALGIAIAVWVYTTVIPAMIALATTLGAALLPFIAIAAVIAALAYAWQNNFLGMRDILTQFWENSVKPILSALWDWLATNVPAAIDTLSGFWTNTLLPAIQSVWAWMNDVLFPFFTSITNFMDAVFGLAVRTLAGVWTDTLLPALTDVWSFLSTILFPLFERFGKWLSDTLGPVIETAAGLIRDVLGKALSWASGELQKLTDWFNKLADWINGIGTGGGDLPGGNLPGGNCFVGTTPVTTPDGLVCIADLALGDRVTVLTASGPETALVAKVIRAYRDDLVTVRTSDGQSFACSPNHRWLANGEWAFAAMLRPGDVLKALGDRDVHVLQVRPCPGAYQVHNIEVDHPDHTYLVGGIVVHNAKPAPSPSAPARGAGGNFGSGSMGSFSPSAAPVTNITNSYNFGGNTIAGGLDWAVIEARIEQVIARAARD